MLRNLFVAGAAALVAAGAFAVEVGGLDEIDTRPPEKKADPDKPEPAAEPGVTTVLTPVVEEPAASEVPRLEEPPMVEEPAPGRRRPLGVTVRAGYFLPGSAEDAYAGAFALGASYTLAPRESRVSYEFGLDAAWSERDGGDYSSALTFLRAAALYRPLPSARQLYVLGGANLGFESVDGEMSASNSAGAIDLGVGGRFGSLDTRLAYSVYLGSGNAGGALALSVGYGF